MERISALITRQRTYLLLMLLTPMLALSIRGFPEFFSPFIASYAPDILWAFLVVAVAAALTPHVPIVKIAGAALGFCLLMECSQLYQAPWINDLRATRIGGLLLGHGFLWSDLACYVVGVVLGVTFDRVLQLLWAHCSE